MTQQIDEIHRSQAGIQVLHIHQNSKRYAACYMSPLLNPDDGPQQKACAQATVINTEVTKIKHFQLDCSEPLQTLHEQ